MRKDNDLFEFKIIAGSLKGKLITAPNLGVTRPPLSRMRKAIFDFLKPYLFEADYLDLFSGTGSYLFEAVSRGANRAVGVELETQLVSSIVKQAHKFNVADKLICFSNDVLKAIPTFAEQDKKFDIIMIAPPQYRSIIDDTLRVLYKNNIVSDNGLILCQHDTSERKINFSGFDIFQVRKYGNTTFTILKSQS